MKKLILSLILILVITYLFDVNFNNRVILVSQPRNYKNPVKSSSGEDKLKLLTYNIHHGVGTDGKLNLDRVAKVIKRSGADIIGLNEVDFAMKRSYFKNQVSYLAEILGYNYAFGASVKRFTGSYGNAILSRYPISNAENYMLPSLSNNYGEPRSLLKVEIEIPSVQGRKEKPFYIMSTHLSLNKEERSKQIKWIDDFVSDFTEPYILMGDFNTEFEEINYTIQDTNITTNGLMPLLDGIKSFPAQIPDKEIDLYFSASPINVIKGYAIKSNASDHLPVYLEIGIG